MSDMLDKLSAPFPPEIVSWRVGATNADKSRGMALAYIDARDVQDRLNEVCGTDWQVRHPWSANGKLACEIGIKIDGEWIWRGDGAGDTDVEAEKGAFSDSFKRAAVRWAIGRYLYDVGSPWVALEQKGRTHVIAENEYSRLRSMLGWKAAAAPPGASHTPPRAVPRHTPSEAKQMKLSEIRDGIQQAILAADSVERIDRIIKNHEQDLGLLRDAHAPTYHMLLSLAAGQKGELMNAAAHTTA